MAKKPSPPKKKPGRPEIPIDADQVYKLALLQATNKEIGDFFGCSPDTIENRFSGVLTKARADRKIRLRRAQMKQALGGNVTMLIWLGKQYLGQAEKVAEVPPGENDRPLEDLDDAELRAIAAGKKPLKGNGSAG
jgi:hypothetical protein